MENDHLKSDQRSKLWARVPVAVSSCPAANYVCRRMFGTINPSILFTLLFGTIHLSELLTSLAS